MNPNLLEGTFNFRDLGGYIGDNGLIVKRCMIFRSDALINLTNNDRLAIKNLNIKTIVDLRQPHEVEVNPNVFLEGVATVNLSPVAPLAELSTGSATNDKEKLKELIAAEKDDDTWSRISQDGEAMAKQMVRMAFDPYSQSIFKQIFELILNENHVPLLFHCKGGKDRTGIMSVFFLMSLGVSKDQMINDYMVTKENMRHRNAARIKQYEKFTDNQRVLQFLSTIMDTKESYILSVFDEIDAKYRVYDDYLEHEIGLTKDQLKLLKSKYLEVRK